MPYHGGPQRLFQRAESATFFGREIGLMYMHAHLRYAQALAHVGDADRFLPCAVPGQPDRHPRHRADRDAAAGELLLLELGCGVRGSLPGERASTSASCAGEIALDGGWRVYSSGAGIALGLIVRRFLG